MKYIQWCFEEINNPYKDNLEPCERHAMTRSDEIVLGQFCDQTGIAGDRLIYFLEWSYKMWATRNF